MMGEKVATVAAAPVTITGITAITGHATTAASIWKSKSAVVRMRMATMGTATRTVGIITTESV